MAVCVGFIEKREYISKQITEANNYVASHCYFCKDRYQCKIVNGFKQEMESKRFKTFNLEKQWWAINQRKDEQGNNIPVLKYCDRVKFTFD